MRRKFERKITSTSPVPVPPFLSCTYAECHEPKWRFIAMEIDFNHCMPYASPHPPIALDLHGFCIDVICCGNTADKHIVPCAAKFATSLPLFLKFKGETRRCRMDWPAAKRMHRHAENGNNPFTARPSWYMVLAFEIGKTADWQARWWNSVPY